MKVTQEQLKAFTLKVEEATKECFGARGIVKDSESIWVDTEEAKKRYPDLPHTIFVVHTGFEFDLVFTKQDEEKTE